MFRHLKLEIASAIPASNEIASAIPASNDEKWKETIQQHMG